MEFCPVCIFRKAVADGVQSGESSTEDTLKATPEQGVKRNAYAAPSAKAPSERELAAGVLKQAAYELRRFHGATTAVERGLYQDAFGQANHPSTPIVTRDSIPVIRTEIEQNRKPFRETCREPNSI
jgi:hypothetical protein